MMDFALPRSSMPMLAKLWQDTRLSANDRETLEIAMDLHSSALNEDDLKKLQDVEHKLDRLPVAAAKKVHNAVQFQDVQYGLPSCQEMETAGRRFQKCSRCKREAYCSKECQQLHWKAHELMCFPNG